MAEGRAAKAARVGITLSALGFCGVDDSVEPLMLAAISAQHPWVEWGVLFRDEKIGQPRYASFEWLRRLGEVNNSRAMRLAGHLCADHVGRLLQGDVSFVRKMHEEVDNSHTTDSASPSAQSHIFCEPPRLYPLAECVWCSRWNRSAFSASR